MYERFDTRQEFIGRGWRRGNAVAGVTNPFEEMTLYAHWRNEEGLFQDAAGLLAAGAGDTVARWDDAINGHNLLQAIASKRPTLTATAYKNRLGLVFDHTAEQVLRSTTFQGTSSRTQGTWFLAFQRPGLSRVQGFVEPTSGVLGVHDEAGGLYFSWHNGAFVYGHVSDFTYHGKALVVIYDGTQGVAANRMDFLLNNEDKAISYTGDPDPSTLAVAAGLDMGLYSGLYLNGTILDAAFMQGRATPEQMTAVTNYYATRFFDQGQKKFHVLGDSIPKGYPDHTADGLDWPNQLLALLDSSWSKQSVTTVAYQIDQMEPQAVSTIDPDRDAWRAKDIVYLCCGTNDGMNGDSGATALTQMASQVAARHNKGYEVIVQTLPYADATQSGLPITQPDYETFRAAYNAGVRNGDTGADHVLDLAARSGWDDPGRNAAFYNADNIHTTDVGNADIAAAVADLLATI